MAYRHNDCAASPFRIAALAKHSLTLKTRRE